MSKARIQDPPLPVADGHHLSRRKFIFQCSAVATVAAVPVRLGLKLSGGREVALNQLSFSAFRPLVGTRFNVRLDQVTVGLELVEASDSGSHPQPAPANTEPDEFSLIFRGAGDRLLEQNSYLFAQAQLGRFEMFIVPVGAPGATGERHYQAVFNRPVALAASAQSIYG